MESNMGTTISAMDFVTTSPRLRWSAEAWKRVCLLKNRKFYFKLLLWLCAFFFSLLLLLFLLLFLLLLYYLLFAVCVCVCRFPQKNARIKREMCRKRDTRMKTFGLWNRMTKAIFDLTSAYPYWQFQAIAMRTNVRKKCCLKPTFKCIFHIRHVHQTKRYLDVSMLFSRNKTNGETRTHLNKNVFIEDLAFVCRCRRCSHRHWQCCG